MIRQNPIHTLAMSLLGLTFVIPLSACSSTSSRGGDRVNEIDPAIAYKRRQRAEAREHYQLATELAQEGKNDEALEEYRAALELDDQLYAAWNNMGQLLMNERNYADAVAAFQIAAGIEPTDPRPLYNTGLAYQRVGWASDAYASYERALSRDPLYLPAMRGLVRSAEMLGSSSIQLRETIKQAQLRENDEQWRDYFRAQYDRVELLLDSRKRPNNYDPNRESTPEGDE